jgi:acyl-CoA dehydrogenase
LLITADIQNLTLNEKLAGWALILMLLEMTEEQTLIVAMVRRFVREEILPLELNLDPDTDILDPDDEARLTGLVKEMGLYGMGIPP